VDESGSSKWCKQWSENAIRENNQKKELKDNVEVNNIYFLYFSRAG